MAGDEIGENMIDKLSDEFHDGIHASKCPAKQGSIEECICNIKRWHDAIVILEQKLEGFEAVSLVPVGYGVDEQRGWGEYVAIRKSDWDKIVATDQALATQNK